MMILNDLSDAVLDCSLPITVTRFKKTPLLYGRKQDPETERLTMLASITPASGEDLQRLPEGQRLESTLRVFTQEELKTVETSECNIADRFEFEGFNYQVALVKDWFSMGGYYEAMAVRLER